MRTLTKFILLFLFFGSLSVKAQNTVVDIIVNSEDHETLEAAVIAADLAGTLSGDGPFTVFAPTDDAFAALPAGTLDTLLADPSGALTDILLYHVLGAEVLSTDLSDGQTATTLLGEDISISISNDSVIINDVALVITADIIADNGVVHVIDAVLTPSTSTSTILLSDHDVSVNVYPNPSKGNLFIRVNDPGMEFQRVRIINMLGQTVYERDIVGQKYDFDLGSLTQGQYMLHLSNKDQYYVRQISVQ